MPPKRKAAKTRAKQNLAAKPQDPVDLFHQAFYTDDSSSDGDTSEQATLSHRGGSKRKRNHKPKRPKTPAKELADISDNDHTIDDLHESGASKNHNLTAKIVTTLGRPQLTIDFADLLVNGRTSKIVLPISNIIKEKVNIKAPKLKGFKNASSVSMTAFPYEIMTRIYRLLFVTPERPILFTEHRDFQRSAQFLRTCRRIHEEGTAYLYGENAFHFARANKVRGTYFEQVWKEIGYKDVRRFFSDIGPHNIAKLKYVSITLDDALPSLTQFLPAEDRKYSNDAVLIEILNMLAKYAKLEKFAVGFGGGRALSPREYHFLKALCSIRCHDFKEDVYHGPSKVLPSTLREIKKLVQIPKVDENVDESKKKFVPLMWNQCMHFI